MKILITGATGFVGSALTKKLLEKGHQIHYLTTSEKKIENHSNYKGFLWNVAKQEIDNNCFEGVDIIVNLAGKSINSRWNAKNKKEIMESRVQASHLLFRSLSVIDHTVVQVISASAIGFYPSDYEVCYTEKQQQANPEFLGQVCKLWEAHNLKFSELGIQSTIFRFGLILSADGGALPQFTKLIRLNLGSCLGSGKQWYSWIHYEDVIGMLIYGIEQQLSGIYNCVAPHPLRQKEFLNIIAKQLHKVNWLPRVPELFLKIVLGEKHQLVTDSQQVSSEKIVNKGFEFKFPVLKKALADIYKED